MDARMTDVIDDENALTVRRDNQIARQDFSGQSLQTQNGAIEALVAKARADVEAACVMAKRWPRNLDNVRAEIMMECRRPGLAAVAMYAKPVGSKKVGNAWEKQYAEGLSIRFAEVAMRCMGNMEASSECIYDDSAVRVIRILVVDYERNSRWRKDISITKTVERRELKKGQRAIGDRINSYGDRVFIVEATDSEVAVKEAAEISKASRTGILRVVPGNLQDEAKEIIRKAALKGATDPAEARNRVFDALATIGIKPLALEEWLGHSSDTISPAEVEELRLVYVAIKEGECTWADALRDAYSERDDKPAKVAPVAPAATTETKASPATTSEPPRSPGKATLELKGKLKPSAPVTVTIPPAQAKVDLPPGTEPAAPGYQYRRCATQDCGVAIEVPIADPPGAVCEACSAGRE